MPRPKQAALAESTVFYQITHAEKRDTLSAQFFLSNNFRLILRIKNIDAHDEVDSWENSIFSRKRRTKDCFLLTHNPKNKKVSVRDKISSRCAICSPAVKSGPSFAGFHKPISVATIITKLSFAQRTYLKFTILIIVSCDTNFCGHFISYIE